MGRMICEQGIIYFVVKEDPIDPPQEVVLAACQDRGRTRSWHNQPNRVLGKDDPRSF